LRFKPPIFEVTQCSVNGWGNTAQQSLWTFESVAVVVRRKSSEADTRGQVFWVPLDALGDAVAGTTNSKFSIGGGLVVGVNEGVALHRRGRWHIALI